MNVGWGGETFLLTSRRPPTLGNMEVAGVIGLVYCVEVANGEVWAFLESGGAQWERNSPGWKVR